MSPELVVEPLRFKPIVSLPLLFTAIAALEEVNDCTAAELKVGE